MEQSTVNQNITLPNPLYANPPSLKTREGILFIIEFKCDVQKSPPFEGARPNVLLGRGVLVEVEGGGFFCYK